MPTNTKQAIAQAYGQLISRKNIDKITVKDVVEECGITRQTFYYHFQDLLDVIEWSLKVKTENTLEECLKAGSKDEAINIFLKAASDNRMIIRKILVSQKRPEITELVHNSVCTWLRRMIIEKERSVEIPIHDLEFALQFYSYAISGILLEIVKNDEADLSEISRQINLLMNPFEIQLKCK